MTAIETLLQALTQGQEDIVDGYQGRTKVSATRARKALKAISDAATDARKELLAIRKGEQDPSTVDFSQFFAPEEADTVEE